MASLNFKKLSDDLCIVQYNGKKDLNEILQWAWDNYQSDCNALQSTAKDEGKAEKLQSDGDLCYKSKNYAKALELYNLSIMAALHPVLSGEKCEEPEEKEEYAFPLIDPARYGGVDTEKCKALGKGFASRSAVMYVVNEYEKCLHDIDLALEYGYPEELHSELKERQLNCQKALSDACAKSNVDTGNPLLMYRKKSLQKQLAAKVLTPPLLTDPNPCIPALSSAAKMSYWPNKGRGLIATRDIKPGEVLGIERAFAVGLGRGQLTTYCSTCTLQCFNPLPCPACSQVVFCSKACRARGLSEDHWLECKILASVLADELEARACGYKLLKTFNYTQIKSICDKLSKDKPAAPEQRGFDSKGRYTSSSFQSVYHLEQNWGTYSMEDLISECLIAYRLTKLLQLSERYFVDELDNPVPVTKEDFLETCKLLVNNFVKSSLNSFGTAGQKMSAFKLYPTKSLINHSCSPTISHSTFGRVSFWYALRPIPVGEELSVTFVDCFNIEARSQRRARLLKNQGFICECLACEENWPTSLYLPQIRHLCENCNKPFSNVGLFCKDCVTRNRGRANVNKMQKKNSQRMESALGVLSGILNSVTSGKPINKEDFRSLCEASEVAFKHSSMPSKVLVDFMGSIEYCADAGLL